MLHPTVEHLVKLQYEARGVSFLPKQPVHSLLSGRHASRLRGRGLTFEELRDYRPGDDIRSIDWRATARLQKAHVRVYSEERDRPVLLLVDQRVNMFFGSKRTTKATVAAEGAALAAWRTIDRGDRVGALIFGDEEISELKPHRSRRNALRICGELHRLNSKLTVHQKPNPGMLNRVLERANAIALHDYLVILITDYYGEDETTARLATQIAAHNDMLAVLVYDPLGIRLPGGETMRATDGQSQVSIPSSSEFRNRFETEFQQLSDRIRERLRALKIPVLPICTTECVADQVAAALGRRS